MVPLILGNPKMGTCIFYLLEGDYDLCCQRADVGDGSFRLTEIQRIVARDGREGEKKLRGLVAGLAKKGGE